ncbi:MAG: hypothetical protein HRU41_34430 [Saprospiraceae bacterium]|nr:hypothetical protein [Saprospiraceae bacterium]
MSILNTAGAPNKLEILMTLGSLESEDKDFNQSLRYFRDAYDLYTSKHSWEVEREILFGLWNAFYELGELDSARVLSKHVIDLCREFGDAQCLILNYNHQALLYNLEFKMDSAITVYQEGFKMAEVLSDTASLALISSNMGITFGMQGQLDRALQYFYNSFHLAKNAGLNSMGITATVNIARTYIELDELDTAEFHLKNARRLSEEFNDSSSFLSIVNFEGRIALEQRQYERAQSLFEQLLSAYQESAQLVQVAEILTCLTEVHLGQGNYRQAIMYCNDGLGISEELDLNEYRQDLYNFKSQLLEKIGEPAEALVFLRKYQELRDSFLDAANTARVAEVVARYDAVKKENENQLLRREKEQQESKATQRTYLALAFGALSLLIAALFVFRYRMYLNQKRSRIELEETVAARTEELRLINEELQGSNQELRSFAYIASHDLKEPLRSISGFTSLLERRLKNQLNDETKEYMAYIKKNTAHLHALIADVLAYSLVADEPLKMEEVDLRALIRDVKDNLAVLIENKQGVIDCEKLPKEKILTNYHHLFLICKNLIENGLKYNASEQPKVTLDYREESQCISLYFQDNGIGIAPAYHARIFELFKRLHNRENYQGTGMGLALSQKMAYRLGGHIEVDSQESAGSTFILRIQKQAVNALDD